MLCLIVTAFAAGVAGAALVTGRPSALASALDCTPGWIGIASQAELVDRALTALRLPKATVVGVDLGAAVAATAG